MINSIHLKNFGCHLNKKLEFHPQVNVIVGNNDSGKTTIIRAFDWLFNNQPAGANYLTNTLDDTNVSEVVADMENHLITHRKSKRKNEYEVDGEILKAFGRGVPDEVQKISKFTDLNIQYQLDNPFLLLSTSGEVARYLNKSIDLDIIDTSFSNLEKIKKTNKNKIEQVESSLSDVEEKLKEFVNIDLYVNKANEIIKLKNKVAESTNKVNSINNTIKYYEGLSNTISQYKKIIDKKEKISLLCINIEQVSIRNIQIQKINAFINDIEEKNKQIEQHQILIKKADKVNALITELNELKDKNIHVQNLHKIIKKIEQQETQLKITKNITNETKRVARLISMHEHMNKLEKEKICVTKIIDALFKSTKELLEKQNKLSKMKCIYKKELGNICPLCKQTIKESR